MAKKNRNLQDAKAAKNDEFYTRLEDIEKECINYRNYFEGKTIYCNCDDPYQSNFFRFFAEHFYSFKIKRLICTCYADTGMKEVSLWDETSLDNKLLSGKAYKIDISELSDYDIDEDGIWTWNDMYTLLDRDLESGEHKIISYLKGDGDFRSDECIELLKQSDVVVTNPPFSLFRDYVALMEKYEKKFLIIGNMNAITYKEIFPLIKDNKLWLGYGFNISMVYKTPYENQLQANTEFVKNKGLNPDDGYVKVPAVTWFTNLPTRKREESLVAELYKKYNEDEYPKYENYDAINVDEVSKIPVDYYGVMGVPKTFLGRYNPKEFIIIGCADADVVPVGWKGMDSNFISTYYSQGNTGAYREGNRLACLIQNGIAQVPFSRILIQRIK